MYKSLEKLKGQNTDKMNSHPDKIEEYERKLRLHEDVIRFMTIKIKKYDGKQSKMVETIDNGN